MTIEEKKLIEGYVAGNYNVQKKFIETYSNLIRKATYNTLIHCGIEPNIETIKDLYQNTFLALQKNNCAKLRVFKGECRLSTWIYKIAKNVVFDYLKKNYNEINDTDSLNEKVGENQEQERGDFIPVNKPSPPEEAETDERYALAKQYLRELDRDDRRILELFYSEGYSLKQISKLFETNEDALFMRKKRIEDELRKRYKKDVGL